MTDGSDVPREQVETALRFLEWSHGDALRRPWSDEAHAYYHAIEVVEDTLNQKLRPPDEVSTLDSEQELIQRSREAREEGYVEATLFQERHGNTDYHGEGYFERLKRKIASLLRKGDQDEV